jgi:magnesium-transporting ATPase (P-type)
MASDKINNGKLNLILDSILLLLLLPIAGIGFLMKYVLLSGEDRIPVYGANVDLEFLGLTRHEWGTIHLIISLLFMALLLLHIILHWTCIESFFCKLLPNKFVRTVLAVLAVVVILFTLLGPFMIKPKEVPYQPHYRNRYSYSIPQQSVYDHHILGIKSRGNS